MSNAITLTAAQAAFMARLNEKGFLTNGGGLRYSTAKALAAKGLITLRVEVHNKWFGGYQPVRAGAYNREWVAYPAAVVEQAAVEVDRMADGRPHTWANMTEGEKLAELEEYVAQM